MHCEVGLDLLEWKGLKISVEGGRYVCGMAFGS